MDESVSPLLAWTSEPPAMPGDYLYAYRFNPEDDWTEGRMTVTPPMISIQPDTSETLWIGPIPKLPGPTKEGGG